MDRFVLQRMRERVGYISIRDRKRGIGEIVFAERFDRRHDIREREAFLRQIILNTRRDLGKCPASHKSQLFEQPEPMRNRLGADILHSRAQRPKSSRAMQKRKDNQKRRGISEQTQGAAHGVGRACFHLLR